MRLRACTKVCVDEVDVAAGLFWCWLGRLSQPGFAPTTRGQREEGWRAHEPIRSACATHLAAPLNRREKAVWGRDELPEKRVSDPWAMSGSVQVRRRQIAVAACGGRQAKSTSKVYRGCVAPSSRPQGYRIRRLGLAARLFLVASEKF